MLLGLHRVLLAHSRAVVLLAILSCVPAGYWAAQLFTDVRADLRQLLPENAPSVRTLREMERRFGGWAQLAIVVESPDRAANRRFSDDLVARLRKLPEVRTAQNRVGPEFEFFGNRWQLFIDLEHLEVIREQIEDKIAEAKARANPLLVKIADDPEPIHVDLEALEKRYARQIDELKRFRDGYFESADQKTLAINVRRRGVPFALEENKRLVEAVDRVIEELEPKSYHPELVVGVGGDMKNILEEHETLLQDLALATSIVIVLMSLAIVAYYRRWRALYLLGLPVITGTLWTFGLGYFMVGYLNASSAFLVAIIPGNGINFGLILLARFVEERRSGRTHDAALDTAVRYTARATSTAALAAAVAYGSLMVTDFLGFRHFGVIGGLGMLLSWIATFLILPSLILLVERNRAEAPASLDRASKSAILERPPAEHVQAKRVSSEIVAEEELSSEMAAAKDLSSEIVAEEGVASELVVKEHVLESKARPSRRLPLAALVSKTSLLAEPVGRFIARHPRSFAWSGAVSAVVAAAVSLPLVRDPFEKDFRKLGTTSSLRQSSQAWEAKSDAIFARNMNPQIILADRPEDTEEIVRLLSTHTAHDDRAPLNEVIALASMVPKDQAKKIEILREIRALLTERVIAELDPKQRELARRFRPKEDLAPYTAQDLPEEIRRDFRELDGTEGRVVLALPNVNLNLYHADEIERIGRTLREIRLADGRVVRSSGSYVIYTDMLEAVKRDGPKATIYSFLGVILLAALAYRRPTRIALVVGTLLLGVLWLTALMVTFDLKINFLNFIALPITFGIGIDYAVNILTRNLLERRARSREEAAAESVRATGGAVALCSLTTIIGYGSLLIAHSGALVSFGKVAIFGEFTCLAAATLVLPAWLVLLRDRFDALEISAASGDRGS